MAIFTAIAAVFSTVGTFIAGLGAVGSFLLKTAVGLGLNLLASAIAGKPKPASQSFAINGTLQSGGDVPRSFIFGRTATAGSLVWVNTWGNDGETPNAHLTQVIALSDLPVASLDEVWVNGEKVTLGHNTVAGWSVVEYPDCLWIKFHDGTQTTADDLLVMRASNGQRQWEATRVGRGVAYAVVTSKVTKNMFSGIPNFKFVLSGRRFYDPSRDSTVTGGAGSQRWAEPDTWGGDGDHLPAVQIYNLLRGLTYNGQWFYGLQGVTAPRLPVENWVTQINKCRAGNTYRSGGEIPIEAPLSSAIEALLTACQGRLSEVGGVYSIYLGAPDAPVASFTDDDILSSEEQSFTPFFGLADTINGIAATYPSPEDGWAEKAAPPIYRTDLEILAGNRRLMADVALNFVPYPEQVQHLMKSALAEGQRARRHTFVLPPAFWRYAVPGRILTWSSQRNGYSAKLFRVDGAADRANLDTLVDLTEVDPADHNWNSAIDFKPPVAGAVGNMRPQPQPIVDWSAFKGEVKGEDGTPRRPAIRLTWDNESERLVDVVGIEYEIRLASNLSRVTDGRTDQPQAGSILVSQSILPATAYHARGRYIPGGDRPTEWSSWLPVTTDDIRLSASDIWPVPLSQLADDAKNVVAWIGNAVRDLRDEVDHLQSYIGDSVLGSIGVTQLLQREISVSYEDSRAKWTEAIEVAAGPTSALAQRVEAMNTSLDGKVDNTTFASWQSAVTKNGDDITALNTTQQGLQSALTGYTGPSAVANALTATNTNVANIGGVVTAQASRVDSLFAAMGGNTTEILVRNAVVAGPAGYARIAAFAKASTGGVERSAGYAIDLPNDPLLPSRFGVYANQFVFIDPSNPASVASPVMFDAEGAYMALLRVGTIKGGVLESPDGKFRQTINTGTLEWFD